MLSDINNALSNSYDSELQTDMEAVSGVQLHRK